MKYKVAIVGATGYTGSELVRLLLHHEDVEIALITADSRKGEQFVDVHPQFQNIFDATLEGIEAVEASDDLDVVFLALPHGISMAYVERLQHKHVKIIDLSGDFRLSGPEVYHQWYQKEHTFPQGFDGAVYGLPELNREAIKRATLVANPGCFPTSAILPLIPLVSHGLIDPSHIIVDSKTGVTGAGNKPKPNTHFPVVSDNFTAYNVKKHRHSIEIQEQVAHAGDSDVKIVFTPHLLPIDRGILSTSYSVPAIDMSEEKLKSVFNECFADEPFVRLTERLPSVKQVRGTNFADIYVTFDERTNTVITVSVIDNLVKGAAGQAIQNMNIMLDLPEDKGLHIVPLQP